MSSVNEHLSKLREERIAREKARIEKLRELNLKKYSKIPQKVSATVPKLEAKKINHTISVPKNNFHVNGTSKRPITAPAVIDKKPSQTVSTNPKPNSTLNGTKISSANVTSKIEKTISQTKATNLKVVNKITTTTKTTLNVTKTIKNVTNIGDNAVKTLENISETKNDTNKIDVKLYNGVESGPKGDEIKGKPTKNFVELNRIMTNGSHVNRNLKGNKVNNGVKSDPKLARISHIPKFEPSVINHRRQTTAESFRKSFQPTQVSQSTTKLNPNRQSVFERLYQPKAVSKPQISDAVKLQSDPNFLNKVIKNSGLILNKRYTTFEPKKVEPPVRRSISAVHFKRISKSELNNCIQKWSSIGENLDKVHLKHINEDASVKGDKIISAVKSDRKKVKFQTPVPFNFNTPRPEELQARLQSWLQKRGKSIDSYHHLQCFGIHHLARKEFKPLNFETEEFDDEDKENQPLESDSDNDSYENNMNNKDIADKDKWRRASNVSDSVDLNETHDTTLTSTGMHHVDELLLGALNDLAELLHEGFDWEQCARWLRAIRERFPYAPESAQYWECRAALEERRGDLPASVQCWEEAIAKGTERSVVEANLDQLLDKFMQLKISPNSGKRKQPDPKMVDVKNVFKSTLIRFAVQQAKLRQSQEPVKFTVTPVRRSGRLSARWSGKRAPLTVCSSVRQAGTLGHPLVFVPNDKLPGTP